MKNVKSRKLGVQQRGCLEALRDHHGWPGGWIWDTPSLTKKILHGLVDRGLVVMQRRPNGSYFYRINLAGEDALKKS